MKINGDKKYIHWGITAFLVICGGLLFYYILFHGSNIGRIVGRFAKICYPFIVGFILAYLLTPIVNTFDHRIFYALYKKNKIKKGVKTPIIIPAKAKKRFRIISIICTYLLLALVMFALVATILPQVTDSVTSITKIIPTTFNKYYRQVSSYFAKQDNAIASFFMKFGFDINDFIKNLNLSSLISNVTQYLSSIGSLVGNITTTIIGALKTTFNVIIGLIVSVYFLMDKEKYAAQTKKLLYAVFDKHNANKLIKDARFTHKTFVGFISGKLVDSLIIGLLCFIGLTILNTHYTVLISVIVGVTNIIPFFGPYLGAIPSALLLIIVSPMEALTFIIFVLILQQIDGNIIGPKILGNSTGLSGFWVIFSITFFGAVWGIMGMFVGVPVFAVIYAFIKRFTNRRLLSKNLSSETEKYIRLGEINENNEYIEKSHLYTEIRNPKGIQKAQPDDDNDKYTFFAKSKDYIKKKVTRQSSNKASNNKSKDADVTHMDHTENDKK